MLTDLDYRVLRCLNDWKSAREVALELGISVSEARASLERLARARKVWRDGPLYISRWGRW